MTIENNIKRITLNAAKFKVLIICANICPVSLLEGEFSTEDLFGLTEWVTSYALLYFQHSAIDVYDWQYVKTDQCKIKTTLVENIMNAKGYQKISLAFLTTIVVINLYATWLDWSVKSSGWTRHFSLIRNYNGFINPELYLSMEHFGTSVAKDGDFLEIQTIS
uniref:Uncharacterized protein n=1 Tax=Tetranychus urticae TaxID=32264 RepID=T1KSQ4_TETUR